MRRLRRLCGRLLPAPGQRPATAYKDWWNNVSTTLDDAYASTISTQGEAEYRLRGWHGDTNSYGAKQFIERAQLSPQSRVLEIGCGIARIGREMAPRVAEWHGADISPNMLALARRRCAHLPNVTLHELENVRGLRQFPDHHFDFVYATIVLMHLDKEDVFEYLVQTFRMLRVGGTAYFDTWNLLHPDTFRQWRENTHPGDNKQRGRMQCMTPEELRAYLVSAGFDIASCEPGHRLVRIFARRSVETPAPVADDGLPPFGYVGSPRFGAAVSGTICIDGWCMDNVREVRLFVDGTDAGCAELRQPYPGVQKALPQYAESAACGFRLDFDTAPLPAGLHEIRAVATDAAGLQTVLSGECHCFIVGEGGGRP